MKPVMSEMNNTLKVLIAVIAAIVTGAAVYQAASPLPQARAVTKFPIERDKTCRDGRAKIFDECSDQRKLYAAARARAKDEGKVLLVEYGAEWCIWCHVFAEYVGGTHGRFTHTYSDQSDAERYTSTIFERAGRDVSAEAIALNRYVAETFVIVYIDSRYAPGGDAVLAVSGADAHMGSWIPHIYSVGVDGRVADVFDHDRVELRRDSDDWFRGYDRKELLTHLTEMAEAAR